ncbi:hypothetical protein RRG08_063892 [Elysia crispata]|uniref:Uncharacterized protein n=1 Tax=Elysia crispata TaxID=231223 RepID=A0AAE1B9B3_9GAST|nr:hypothetical protein RRG08_063892 [Elysia crispata]
MVELCLARSQLKPVDSLKWLTLLARADRLVVVPLIGCIRSSGETGGQMGYAQVWDRITYRKSLPTSVCCVPRTGSVQQVLRCVRMTLINASHRNWIEEYS